MKLVSETTSALEALRGRCSTPVHQRMPSKEYSRKGWARTRWAVSVRVFEWMELFSFASFSLLGQLLSISLRVSSSRSFPYFAPASATLRLHHWLVTNCTKPIWNVKSVLFSITRSVFRDSNCSRFCKFRPVLFRWEFANRECVSFTHPIILHGCLAGSSAFISFFKLFSRTVQKFNQCLYFL